MAEERGLADMLARLALTAAEVTAMGAALGEVAAWWPQGKRPAPKHVTLRDLAGFRGADGSPEWGPLSALVAHVRAEAQRAERLERAERRAPTQAVTLPTPEEAQRLVDEARARGGLLARKKEQADG